MMKRRAALAAFGGTTLLAAGCLSAVVTTPEPVHFELWNRTDAAHEVAVTIRDDGGDTVLDRTYAIEDASAGPPGGNVRREEAIAEAVNGTHFDIEAILDSRTTWAHRFVVTCAGREPENVLQAEITSGREPSVTFDHSVCG